MLNISTLITPRERRGVMTNSHHRRKGGGHQRRISVRAVRRQQPDLRKLSRALLQLAAAQAAAEAAAKAQAETAPTDSPEASDD
jgi:hypothetical protein